MSRRRHLTALLALACIGATACNLDVVDPNSQRSLSTPTAVYNSPALTQLSAGFYHTCGLTANGTAYCWGSNQLGQVGSVALLPSCPTGTCAFVPVQVGDGRTFKRIAAGTNHTCGIASDDQTYCWGGTSVTTATVLGDGLTVASSVPVRVRADSVFTDITLGGAHSCGLTAGGLAYCWGRNELGQLGDSSIIARGTPVPVTGNLRFRQLSAGADFTCGLTASGALYCWGSNQWGQLGTGDVGFNVAGRISQAPTLVVGGPWTMVAAGGSHACALARDGFVSCWGRNDNMQQLGDSSGVTHRGVPGRIKSSLTFATVAAGAGHSCARTASGEAWCWGGNSFGYIGNGRTTLSGEPVPVKPQGGPYAVLALGGSHTCGIETSGGTKCWGDKWNGALGIR